MSRSEVRYCIHCGGGLAWIGKFPEICPFDACAYQLTTWLENAPDPRTPWLLSRNDQRLLRSFRITPE